MRIVPHAIAPDNEEYRWAVTDARSSVRSPRWWTEASFAAQEPLATRMNTGSTFLGKKIEEYVAIDDSGQQTLRAHHSYSL